jgi:hypothetical protein
MEVKQQALELIKSSFLATDEYIYQDAVKNNTYFRYDLWRERYYTYLEVVDLYKIKKLDLSMLDICYLLPEFGYLSTLEELNISGNYIPELPDSLWNLHNLKYLYLGSAVFGGNPFKELSPKIKNLKNLEILDISLCNNLTTLPKELLELDNLLYLRLSQENLYKSDIIQTLKNETECCIILEETLPPIEQILGVIDE